MMTRPCIISGRSGISKSLLDLIYKRFKDQSLASNRRGFFYTARNFFQMRGIKSRLLGKRGLDGSAVGQTLTVLWVFLDFCTCFKLYHRR